MIDLLNVFKLKYLVLFLVVFVLSMITTNRVYYNQKNTYVSEILIKPVPLYENVFMNYSLFNEIQFNRSQLTSAELIDLVANKLRDTDFTLSIAEELGIDNTLINLPFISYPRINPAEGIPVGSIILKVNSFSPDQINDYLIDVVKEAESFSRNKIYEKFNEFLDENENLKNDQMDKIRLSIKKIITLFDNEIRDIENEIRLSKDLGFVEPIISQNFAADRNNYLAGTVVLERRVRDIQNAKDNIAKLLDNLDDKPIEQAVYQIVHEFVRYVDEHAAFARVGGTGLTKDLLSFKVYEYIENSTNIKQALKILKRSEFDLVIYNKSSVKIKSMKKSIRSYYIFAGIMSIFFTLLIITILEIYNQRHQKKAK